MPILIDEYENLVRTEFVETDEFVVIYFKLYIANLPTSASPTVFTDDQKESFLKVFRRDLSKYRIQILKITGFASESGTPEFNLELSKKRASEFYDLIIQIKQDNNLSNLNIRSKEEVVKYFGELELPTDDPNTPLARKVEIRFSQKYIIPKPEGGEGVQSKQWKLDLGPEITTGFTLLPFSSVSNGKFYLMPDGDNYNGPEIEVRCTALMHTFRFLDFGIKGFVNKNRFFRRFAKRIAAKIKILDDEIINSIKSSIPEIRKVKTRQLLTRLIKENLLEFGIQVDIPDYLFFGELPNPIFFTETPYTLKQMQSFDMIGADGSIGLPILGVMWTFSIHYVMVSPPALFVNMGLSFDPQIDPQGWEYFSLNFKYTGIQLDVH